MARGRYLYLSRGCADCHGRDGAGHSFVEADGLHLRGANITRGDGSAIGDYTVVDWVRAIRHGVKPDGRPLRVMPSEDYNRLTDADLGALVAFVKSLPPASGAPARIELPLPARVAYGLGMIPEAVEKIDHSLPPSRPVPEGDTVEHGAYVARMCVGCHGPELAGGRIPGSPPDWPAAADLRPGAGVMSRYASADDFLAMLRQGQRPDGSAISPVMPFQALREMSEVDARALYRYLREAAPSPGAKLAAAR
jgi:mono/diheme cytochrome c family protein